MHPSEHERAASTRSSVEAAHRAHWGSVLASTLALTRDLDLAEDSAQEAFSHALTSWADEGVPANPGGWLATVARRRALDTMRRSETLQRKLPLLIWSEDTAPGAGGGTGARTGAGVEGEADARIQDEEHPVVLDEQLRLIFLAAHPALAPESRIALTLRLVRGVPTADIAAAFLVSESTMAARLTRAKKRIRVSRIPCRVPGPGEIDARVVDVLDVLSVLLATGGDPNGEPGEGAPASDAAVRILETLHRLLPGHTEIHGLLAQALAQRARESTRFDAARRPVALAEQDRSRWDRDLLDRADALVLDGLARGGRGPYLLQGAIAAAVAVPDESQEVDWAEVLELYDVLLVHWPTAIVRLGRAVALAELEGPLAALAALEPLAETLDAHRHFHVIRGELLQRAGRDDEAAAPFRTALQRRGGPGDTAVLEGRMQQLGSAPWSPTGGPAG
ncbi:RNA polymerase sigma factor [Brachybacterium endophyticum]|uniref:RNA polymerase sigma factor n=1 Tax=Brachybacterium endophyticum TaxID=2182385 RepID=UPI0014035781|nr:sigma-70 family RNA polymerase sigma factor [Brachybacterium endophyticum]